MRLRSLAGAAAVLHPVHGEATVGADGLFEVDEEFGRALLANPAQWATPDAHLAHTNALELADVYDGRRAAAVLAKLRARVAAVRAGDAEPPAAPWRPDPTTIGLLSAQLRHDEQAVSEFWALQYELEQLAAVQASAAVPVEEVAGATTSATPASGSKGGK